MFLFKQQTLGPNTKPNIDNDEIRRHDDNQVVKVISSRGASILGPELLAYNKATTSRPY